MALDFKNTEETQAEGSADALKHVDDYVEAWRRAEALLC